MCKLAAEQPSHANQVNAPIKQAGVRITAAICANQVSAPIKTAEKCNHEASVLTVALLRLLAASRCALQGLHTSSSSSALL